jgi:hypothetical protein
LPNQPDIGGTRAGIHPKNLRHRSSCRPVDGKSYSLSGIAPKKPLIACPEGGQTEKRALLTSINAHIAAHALNKTALQKQQGPE